MADWIYCATNAQVDAEHTANLLLKQNAIWCPPKGVIPPPQEGDRIWLVWRDNSRRTQTELLGGGTLLRRQGSLQNTDVYWTDADKPGMLQASIDEGYSRQTTDTAFLILDLVAPVVNPPFPNVARLGQLDGGLNLAKTAQVAALQAVLPIS